MMNTAQEAITREAPLQNDILDQIQSQSWLLGESNKYNKELAFYPEDLISFVADFQAEQNSTSRNFRIVHQEGFVRCNRIYQRPTHL